MLYFQKGMSCSAKGCKSRTGDLGIVFFRYPKDYLARGWMRMVNKPLNWKPKPNTRMCSQHFPPGSFTGRKLLPGANPDPNPALVDLSHHGMCCCCSHGSMVAHGHGNWFRSTFCHQVNGVRFTHHGS